MGLPEYLYHYTSIEALAQILKNKTIRFTKLSLLNDPTEGQTGDYEHSSKLVYSSSWTASSQDTIPLWKMYTDLKGVRIKMPINMFETDNRFGQRNFLDEQCRRSTLNTPLDIETIQNGNRTFIKIDSLFGPDAIKYSNSSTDIKVVLNCVHIKGLSKALSTGNTDEMLSNFIGVDKIGLYKPEHWSFEQEWRFRLMPDLLSPQNGIKASEFYRSFESLKDYYDLQLRNESLDCLEILLGPKTDSSHRLIVESLCSNYIKNNNINISKSLIQVR